MTKTELKDLRQRYFNSVSYIKQASKIGDLYRETDGEREQRIKKLMSNYGDFFMYYFGFEYADAPCAVFQIKAATELLKMAVIIQFRNWYRGAAKSVHSNLGNPFFLKQHNELKYMLLIGTNEKRAIELLGDIQVHLEHNERIIADFGNQKLYGSWECGQFDTIDGSRFTALGIEQDFRGLRKGANRIDFCSIDDIEQKKTANNPRIVRERINKIQGDIVGAFSLKRRRMVVSNNIFTNGVISGLIESNADNPYLKITKVPVVDKNGEPTWNERLTKEDVAMLRQTTDSLTWEREYLLNIVEEGTIFSPDMIRFDEVTNIDHYDKLLLYGDLSYADAGDYKAIGLMGRKENKFFLIDCYVKQGSRQEATAWCYDTYEKYNLDKNKCRFMFEGCFAQGLFFSPDFDAEGKKRGYYIPIVADKATKGNKYDRIESMLGHFERAEVIFNQKHKLSTHFQELKNQLLAFEKGSKAHDDAPDMLQSAISILNKAAGRTGTGGKITRLDQPINRKNAW